MNIEKTLDLCVDMLLFLNHTDLEGEPEIGIKMDREDGQWTVDFRDYNDESLSTMSGVALEPLLELIAQQLQARVDEMSKEAGNLLDRGQRLLARVP